MVGIDKRCFLLHGLQNYARDRVFVDSLSSTIKPQNTMVTRFGVVELSEAMLLALARRGTRKRKTRPN
jgi:hypothetical protein